MKVGILTGGGDAPGLNGIIEASTKSMISSGHTVIGIRDGFEGIFDNKLMELTWDKVDGAHADAGTILGTSNKCGTEGRESEFVKKFKAIGLDGLIAAGGDGTFRGLQSFKDDVPLIGVPKTIDNDLSGTDITFGYDTACTVVAESVDSLRATANAHDRVIFVEVMGRTAGWIALGGGMSSYADAILIPERPFNPDELLKFIKKKHANGKRGILCVVSEGAFPKGGDALVAFTAEGSPQEERYGGIAEHLARWIEKETDKDARHVVLGHLQRSKSPSITDRFLTLAMGATVGQLVNEKKWGYAATYKNGIVQSTPITDFMGEPRLVDPDHKWVKITQNVGIFI